MSAISLGRCVINLENVKRMTFLIGKEKLWTTPASNLEDPRVHKILLGHHEEHENVPACAAKVQEQPAAYATTSGGHGVSKSMPP
jgi:hypothetical protein